MKNKILFQILSKFKQANAGHIGSALSCLDILYYLYFDEMNENDEFILSKGHAALALYCVLYAKEIINEDQLKTFYQDGTVLAAHPPFSGKLAGVKFGSGSLGHGLSLATGLALAAKLKKNAKRIFCLLSDGDCNEGSTWEAALFAAHHQFKNLFAIIDHNKIQGFGKTNEILDLSSLAQKWESFGFDVIEIENGNNVEKIANGFVEIKKLSGTKPKCIILHTTKGNGISFMENKLEWHYLPMNDKQYEQALIENNLI